MIPVLMSWSGGKDSCFALHELQRSGNHDVIGLLTTVTREHARISMHGVHHRLLERQAAMLGLPLFESPISTDASNEEYEAAVAEALAEHRAAGVKTVAYGDLFLADIRAYRDRLLARNGMNALYPVWGRPTRRFVGDFISAGFKAVIVCVDLRALDASFAGRMVDETLLNDLPIRVDPCGENGEYHTFVFDGPNFRDPVAIAVGERIARGDFCFCDIEPSAASA
ncbi:MAG: diphthine--ammonia ligase [Caulobacteraceae bacterium]